MITEYHHHFSHHLQRTMEFKRYGNSGKVVVVFPSSEGRFYEYEDFGMIASLRALIDAGTIQVCCIDSIDGESWLAPHPDLEHKLAMADRFEAYVIDEFIPCVQQLSRRHDPVLATGCSMGAYHAVTMALKHPDVFDQVIALSGIYDVRYFVGETGGQRSAYLNSPLDFIWHLDDGWFLDHYRSHDYIICVGQGDYEAECLHDTKKLQAAFEAKQIEAWFDYWGHDVSHDWVWWRRQIVYFFSRLGY